MNRRTFIVTGVLAGGTSLAIGSGAFSTVEGNRDISVNVKKDNEAYLSLEPTEDRDIAEIHEEDGKLLLNFGEQFGDGDGLNSDSEYEFSEVFTATNHGTRTVYLWGETQGVPKLFLLEGGQIIDIKNQRKLTSGESVTLSVLVNTDNGESDTEAYEGEFTIVAASKDSEYREDVGHE